MGRYSSRSRSRSPRQTERRYREDTDRTHRRRRSQWNDDASDDESDRHERNERRRLSRDEGLRQEELKALRDEKTRKDKDKEWEDGSAIRQGSNYDREKSYSSHSHSHSSSSRRDRERRRERSRDRESERPRRGDDNRRDRDRRRDDRETSSAARERTREKPPPKNDIDDDDGRSRHSSNRDSHQQTRGENSTSPPPPPKEQPNFSRTAHLVNETNTVNGVVLKYVEPPEARLPPTSHVYRLYVFKDSDLLQAIELSGRTAWLVGREGKVADIHVEHPSCSGQHAVIQFRRVVKQNEWGDKEERVKPYIMDLASANGTRVNGEVIPKQRFYELMEKDLIVFGHSSREYVLMLEK